MTHPDFIIASVLAWARTKPADQTYDYQAKGNCALCQFLKNNGLAADPMVAAHLPDGRGGFWRDWAVGGTHGYPLALEYALAGPDGIHLSKSQHWTFGGLVKRLQPLTVDAYLADMVEA
jgi:hypothetical protein